MSNKDILNNIKKLRELTGVGFKDCKVALDESKGDIEKSIEFLRKKGIAKASKKMSRTASEGLVLVKEGLGEISIIEINSETDFVAKNKDFISFCKELSDINFSTKGDIDKLNNSKMKNKALVKDSLVNLIAKIGEKITIRRVNFFDNKRGKNFFYVHSAIEKNIGKIICVVKMEGIIEGKNDDLGNKLSMHIAAFPAEAVKADQVSSEVLEKEKDIFIAQARESGKPDNIIEKMIEGRLNKFLKEVCVESQPFVKDPQISVSNLVNKTAKELGVNINFNTFEKYQF